MAKSNTSKKIDAIYQLTPLQEGMLFNSIMGNESKNNRAYISRKIIDINGSLDIEKFEKALDLLSMRYDVLRTVFIYDKVDKPRQVVLKERKPKLNIVSIEDAEEQNEEFEKIVQNDVVDEFNLQKDTLIRVTIVKFNNQKYKIILSIHHIIIDGWCIPVLLDKLFYYYGKILNNVSEDDIKSEIIKEREIKPDFKAYVDWVKKSDQNAAREYWKNYLDEYDEVCEIEPISKNQASESNHKMYKFAIDADTTSRIVELVKKKNVTVNTFVETILGITFQKATRTNDVVYGRVISKRNIDVDFADEIVGILINTVPVRITTNKDETFSSLLGRQYISDMSSEEYSYYSLADIEALSIPKNNLIKIIYAFENFNSGSKYEDFSSEKYSNNIVSDFDVLDSHEETEYDISISCNIFDKELSFFILHNPERYSEDDMKYLFTRLKSIVESVLENPEVVIENMAVISDSEKDMILNEFNNTSSDYAREKTVVEMIEEQAERVPDKTAIIFDDDSMTYSELNSKANDIAHKLMECSVKRGDRVAIILKKDIMLPVAILGILKTGATYVPVDTEMPVDRIDIMLKDINPSCILTNGFEDACINNVINIDIRNAEIYGKNYNNSEEKPCPEDAAYILYTSGTTGTPKGIIISHKALACDVHNFVNTFSVDENTVSLQQGSYTFDLYIEEVFPALCSGGKIAMLSKEKLLNVPVASSYISEKNVTLVHMTPMLINEFNKYKWSDKVKTIIIGGEKVQFKHIKPLLKLNCSIFQAYGSTENTVVSTIYKIKDAESDVVLNFEKGIPIGKPKLNTKVYIINGENLCGIGMPGELCIAGDCLADGYLNLPEISSEKFVKNPFGEGRMYRSGDLARWLPDGNIEFIGRIDEQVKIRGIRIEPAEIEVKIRSIKGIKECAVVVRVDNSGEKALYAYFTSNRKMKISDIRSQLSSILPNYMIPSYMMQIDVLPVNKNGKLDRRALPDIDTKSYIEYVAPETETQKIICEIFADVLGIDRVGLNDNFFELGGHSLKATRVVNNIEEKTGFKIAIKDIFANPTPDMISKLIDGGEVEEYSPIPKAEEKEYYKMSSLQRRIYLIQQMEPDATVYNMPASVKLTGEVSPENLKNAIEKLIARHEILRTAFLDVNGELVQKILDKVEANFEYFESTESEEELTKHLLKPFDLSNPPLLRVILVNKGDYHVLMVDLHHIISDGTSESILIEELLALYNGEELEPLTHQYKDFSEWILSKDLESQGEYWKSQFEEEAPVLDMPLDYQRPQMQNYSGANTLREIDEDTFDGVVRVSEETGATEYMIFLAALMVMLSKYSRQEDVVIGSPISGRTHRDTERMLGMFVNTLAMRGRPEGEKTFAQFLEEIKEICLNAYENQDYPFDELVEAVSVRRDMSRNPLFDVMMTYQNIEEADIDLGDMSTDSVNVESNVAKFDMTFDIFPKNGKGMIMLNYCTALFSKETTERIVEHYINTIKTVTADITQKIKDIEFVTAAEKNIILNDFNASDKEYPKNKTIVELFEEQVAKTPDNIAVVLNDEKLTYSELNAKANSLAIKLRAKGLQPDNFAVVIADKSIEMVIGIYAILKSGAAYVPIDPTYPADRISYMLDDCKPEIILKCTDKALTLPEDVEIINLKDDDVIGYETENPESVNKSTDLAYCIYTSGTTGKPKGVIVEHYGVANLREYFVTVHNVNENDRVLQFASIAFDAMVSEMTMGLLTGASMYIVDSETQKDVSKFEDFVNNNKITFAILPPLFLSQVKLNGLRTIITAGSETNSILVNENSNIPVYSNDYGPTEATVCATYWKHNSSEPVPARVPIGKPMNNKKIYVMSGDTLCGIGVPGELCIAGDGLARGYLNRPELTAEKFVKNPFGDGRMYRSGDLARWLPDGNIEYLGRIDEQVKIRGFRIELGEIESRIREMENIKDCAVIAKVDNSGEKAIYAYYSSDVEISVPDIKTYLSAFLPDYMIPSYMMQIDAIPVTRNGKLDKKALPEIQFERTTEYIAPENDIQKMLCDVFSEVLNVENVGIRDNFFGLGGDSIKAIKVVSIIREKGFEITVRDIMQNNNVEALEFSLKSADSARKYEQGEVTGVIEPTPIIKEFFDWKLDNENHFNQSMFIEVGDIDDEILKIAFTEVVSHHDMLRAVVRNGNVEILPVSESKMFDFYNLDLSDAEDVYKAIENKCNEIQRSISLADGPIIKVLSFIIDGKKNIAVFVHHIAVDGVSWRIIQDDFNTAIEQLMRNEKVKLPAKTASYIEWSNMLNDFEKSDSFDTVRKYWGNIKDDLKENALVDSSAIVSVAEGGNKSLEFDSSETALIKKSIVAFNSNLLDIFISAFAVAVNDVTGKENVTMLLESHGREEIHKEILTDRTVGWFTNTYPIIASKKDNWEETVIQNKENIRSVPYNGMGFMQFNNNTIDTKLFVLFNYLGEFSSAGAIDDKRISLGESFSKTDRIKIDNVISVNSSISSDILNFNISYNKGLFTDEFIEQLSESFRVNLLELAEYCENYGSTMYTASDFSDDLDSEDFDSILDLL